MLGAIRGAVTVAVLGALVGCATPIGQADYARVSPLDKDRFNFYVPGVTVADAKGCRQLERKFTYLDKSAENVQVRKGEAFSIFLNAAYLREVSETLGTAEIAIVANVYERRETDYDVLNGARRADESLRGRLVYFSSGVKSKSVLNMSNLPIYGPAEYQGGDLVLQVYVIEVDNAGGDTQFGQLLGTLAQIGAAANPAVSTIAPYLTDLGTSILNRVKEDDVQLRYDTILRGPLPEQPGAAKAVSPLLFGDYFLIRRTGSGERYSFNDFIYWEKNGLVYLRDRDEVPGKQGGCGVNMFNGSTWMTFSIRKDEAPLKLASSKSYGDLLGSLHSESGNIATELPGKLSNLLSDISASLGQQVQNTLAEALRLPQNLRAQQLGERLEDTLGLVAQSTGKSAPGNVGLSQGQYAAALSSLNKLGGNALNAPLTRSNFCQQYRSGALSRALKIDSPTEQAKLACR